MKRSALFLLLLCPSLFLLAQKGSIRGRVCNAKTREAIDFANIRIQGTSIGTITDADGNFRLDDVPPGFVRLLASFVGFKTAISAEVQVQGNRTTFVDMEMHESEVSLGEVVIRPNFANRPIESPVSVSTLGIQELEKNAGVNRDVSKAMQTLPGVGATDPNRNDLIVRGGGPSENVFYLDGVEIPVINHFSTQGSSGGVVGIVNPDFVREISFYTGAFPANRANALSSVMEIRQREGDKERIRSTFSIGASDAALTVDGPIGKRSTFIVSARQSYLKLLFKAIGLPFLPTYNDFQLKCKYDIDSRNEISFIGIGAIDRMTLNTSLQQTGTESQQYILGYLPVFKQWNYAAGVVYKHFGKGYTDTWVLSRNALHNGNFKHRNNDESLPKISDYASEETENKLRFERLYPDLPVKLLFGGGLRLSGYANRTYRQVYNGTTVRDERYETSLSVFGYQVFAQLSDEFLHHRLKLSFGVNAAGNNFNSRMRNPIRGLSPRFSASYALSERWDVNTNCGRYVMQPGYTTMGFKNSQGEYANRNNGLTHIHSDQVVAGFEFRPRNNLRFTLEGFYKKYENYPVSVADGISLAGKGTEYGQVGDEEVTSTGKGRAYGFEFLGRLVEWRRTNVTLTYTFFRSEFTNRAGVYLPSSWDTRHILNLMGSHKFGKSWNLSARWRFVGGAPYSPVDMELSTLKAAWDVTRRAYTDYSRYNSLRLSDAHQLDVRLDKEIYLKRLTLNFYMDVQNAYNFKSEKPPIYTNKDAQGQVMDDPADPANRQQLRVIDYYGGTVLPTVGVIVKF